MKWWLYGAVAAFIGVQAIRFQNRGTKLVKTETALADSTIALGQVRLRNAGQAVTIHHYEVANANLGKENAELREQRAKAVSRAYQSAQGQAAIDQRLRDSTYALSRLRRKLAADALVGGVGAIATSVADSALNGDVASLKNQLRNRDEAVIPELRAALGNETERANAAESDKSDLKRELNGRDNATADYIENVKKPVLNIGYGKKIKKAANEIRAGRVR